MKAVILASDFGPENLMTPKALLEVGEKKLLDLFMEQLDGLDPIKEVVVLTSGLFYLDFFQWMKEATSKYKTPIRIEENNAFVPEKSPGAIRDLCHGLNGKENSEKDALIICADQYFDFSVALFLLFCMSHPKSPFLAVYDIKDKALASRYGVVEIDAAGRVNQFSEEPSETESTFVSVGVYYFPYETRSRIYEYIQKVDPAPEDGIGKLFDWMSKQETLYGVPLDGKWLDIRDVKSYEKVREINHE